MAHTGQVDVDVACRVIECSYLNKAITDCLRHIVTIVGVIWISDQSKIDEVNLLALKNPQKASVKADHT